MIVNEFQTWARTATSSGRADGVSALARAYLYSNLDAGQRAEAVRVLTAFLDDPSPMVRRTLAESLASALDAPHHVVLALADDCASVASVVLARSPILTDAELIDCAATAEPAAQAAIASRPSLSSSVAAALAEIGAADALVVLAGNHSAALPAFSIRRMIERHGEAANLREALLARGDLPPSVRLDLVAATAKALAAFVTSRHWLSAERMNRVANEAGDRAAITVATVGGRDGQGELVAHLRRSGRLTSGFALRAILSGKIELFKAILVELSDMPAFRVDGLTRRCDSTGFAALYRKCELPVELLPAFRLALHAVREADWAIAGATALSRAAIERVLTACEESGSGDLGKLMVLLRRFEAEAARDEARALPAPDRSTPLTLRPTCDEPLLLTDFDQVAVRRPDRRGPPPETTIFASKAIVSIDLAAIEAELLAA